MVQEKADENDQQDLLMSAMLYKHAHETLNHISHHVPTFTK